MCWQVLDRRNRLRAQQPHTLKNQTRIEKRRNPKENKPPADPIPEMFHTDFN
jgi:hypothetical protein